MRRNLPTLKATAAGVALAMAASGCATFQDNPTACKVVTSLAGATLGAVGGGVGVDQIEPTPTDGERAGGAAAGFVAGGLVGLLLGHLICPEPAPPPPAAKPVPPPPPAPISDRRGG